MPSRTVKKSESVAKNQCDCAKTLTPMLEAICREQSRYNDGIEVLLDEVRSLTLWDLVKRVFRRK